MFRTAVAVASVLAVAGCSEAPSTESGPSASETTETTSPARPSSAKGPEISGTGYIYNVPRGWGRPPQNIPGFNPDSLAVDLRDSDGFTDNVTVILSPAREMTPAQLEDAAEKELGAVGAKDISLNDRVTVAGSESVHVTAGMSMNDNDYTIEQFYPTDNGQTFVVTFSFSSRVTARERATVTDAALASWVWTD